MKPIRNLLVPVDFSINSIAVIRHAVEISKKSGAGIIILHVYSRPILNRGGKRSNPKSDEVKENILLKKLENKIDYNFEMILNLVPELKSVKTTFSKVRGTIVDEVIKAISAFDIDLLVMGTRGARGIEEIWGTKAADISMDVKIPVLIMPYESKIMKPAKIALAYDFEKITDYSVLDQVKLFSEVYDAELHILNINGEETSEEEEKNVVAIKNYFKDFNHSIHIKKHSDVEEGIVEHIRHNNISMLVMLHRSRNFFENLFHDSLTQRMAYHSEIPVLVLEG